MATIDRAGWARIFAKLQRSRHRPIDVLGLGECSIDRVVRLPGPLQALLPSALSTHAHKGDRGHASGKARAVAVDLLGGGQIATALCAVRRLGRTAQFLGSIAQDSEGNAVLDGLRREGVDTSHVHVFPADQAATRTALILVDTDGERAIIEHRDPRLTLPDDYPSVDTLAQARIVHLDATFPPSAQRAALLADASGALVSLDVDGAGDPPPSLLRDSDLCVVAETVPRLLTGLPDLEPAARALADQIRGLLVVTRGERGSIAVLAGAAPDDLIRQPAYPAAHGPDGRIDTTSCGDTFRAALLVGLLRSADHDIAAGRPTDPRAALRAALDLASAAAALKCRDLGRRGCPAAADLQTFHETHKPHPPGPSHVESPR